MQCTTRGHACHQILRKREDKENEAREAKRSKMRTRRVSFAPEEELNTLHLYEKASNAAAGGRGGLQGRGVHAGRPGTCMHACSV
jgi:hypothetical protein